MSVDFVSGETPAKPRSPLARWLRRNLPFGWRTVRDTRVHVYQVHRSGKRRVLSRGCGYQPIDRAWLAGGS